jgi:hypothetical protein
MYMSGSFISRNDFCESLLSADESFFRAATMSQGSRRSEGNAPTLFGLHTSAATESWVYFEMDVMQREAWRVTHL